MDPKTNAEWQDAVDLAEGYLALDSARKYGLLNGGPDVDVERCEELLAKGKARGITPAPDAIEKLARALGRVGVK
jgi:hypothetical protein